MKARISALVLFAAVLPAAAYEHPGGFHTRAQLEYVRKQVKAGQQPWKCGYDQLLSKADGWLSAKPRAMADFRVEFYYSKQQAQHVLMKTLLSEDARVAYACALVYQLNVNLSAAERRKYADKAVEFLNNWATVNTKVSGGDGKLVMCYNGTAFVFAAELLWDYTGWSAAEKKQFKAWAKNVLYASSGGKRGHSNRANWYLMAALAVDHLTDDTKAMAADIKLIKPTIDRQIKPDGGMPEELRRGKNSMWYTYFGLAPLTACMEIARNAEGIDLYAHDPPSGGTVKDALDFLFKRGIEQPDSWPVKGARNILKPNACGGNLFYVTGLIYNDARYLKWVKHPIWRDTTGLAWICPSLMAPRVAAGGDTSLRSTSRWGKHKANPVLGGKKYGTIFDVSTLRAGGEYWMYVSWRPRKSIALSRSKDGVNWSEPRIVLGPAKTGWEDQVNRPGVLYKDGVYHMWYTGQAKSRSKIGYATSKDGVTFTRRDEPVLVAEKDWEKPSVMCPHVAWDAEKKLFRMWYSGGNDYEPDAIGYATSPDGVTWTRHAANPIFAADPDTPWEKKKVAACQIVRQGQWHVMFYIGFEHKRLARIGLARSRDGVTNWQRHPANPIISPTPGAWDGLSCYKPFAVYEKASNRWLLWYNGRSKGEMIGLAIHKGEDLGFD